MSSSKKVVSPPTIHKRRKEILAGGKTPKEQRVHEIIRLMTSFQWTPAKRRELEKKWGLIENGSMRHMAAEASRHIRMFVDENREETQAIALVTIQRLSKMALDNKKYDAVARFMDMNMKLLGLYAPTRVNVSGDLAQMTEEELEKKRLQIISQLENIKILPPSLPPAPETEH